MVKLLVREWRRRSTHGGESGWIPWRVAAAGVEEGDLLEVPLVAWRGVGEKCRCCVHESELGAPLYRRSEAVAVNEDHWRAITVAQ